MEKNIGLTILLGGSVSGKSREAHRLVSEYDNVLNITPEELISPDLPELLGRTEADIVLIDSLTDIVAQTLARLPEPDNHLAEVVRSIVECAADVIVVSNEVGFGVVPASPQGRRFRDLLGSSNQRLSRAADHVFLIVAGIPLCIKGGGLPIWSRV
jgi:adenosyl cobinamide kinase/adenosyl cobinamide phosphate guanylyltransferase